MYEKGVHHIVYCANEVLGLAIFMICVGAREVQHNAIGEEEGSGERVNKLFAIVSLEGPDNCYIPIFKLSKIFLCRLCPRNFSPIFIELIKLNWELPKLK